MMSGGAALFAAIRRVSHSDRGSYRCEYSVIFGRSEEVTVQNVPIGVLAGVNIASYFGE